MIVSRKSEVMSETNIETLLGEFYDKLSRLKNLVDREVRFPEAPNKIKVAIGVRRAGKSYLIYQYVLRLLREGINKTRILYINFEDDRLLPLDQAKLANLVEEFYSLYPENYEQKCYLFFDEIQNVDDWALVIRRLHDTKNAEIFLTGSSAKLLSKEIATSLRGRSLAVEVWPYSFQEFIQAKEIEIDTSFYDKKTLDKIKRVFNAYLSEGGFPEVVNFNPDERQQTLQDYLDIVIYRDIIERHNIKSPALVKYMCLSMIHNVAKPFTVNKFFNDVKSQGYVTGKDMLYEYADHIEDAYLAFSIELHDRSIRKVKTNPKKIYAIDPGMARALTLNYESDLGRLFENIVYLDLKRRRCKVNYYLTAERHEIDFIVQTPRGQRKLFQVAWDHSNQNTFNREQRALEEGMKELSIDGEILTLESYLRKGIVLD